jgi:hypothetical protein
MDWEICTYELLAKLRCGNKRGRKANENIGQSYITSVDAKDEEEAEEMSEEIAKEMFNHPLDWRLEIEEEDED